MEFEEYRTFLSQGELHEDSPIIPHYILLKLATRCNLACTYCYWFRDEGVYDQPKVLTPEVEKSFLEKLSTHIQRYHIKSYFVLFHGGEPLLFGKKRFRSLCQSLRDLEAKLNFRLRLAVTTNGLLLDSEWVDIFQEYQCGVTISLDGPKKVHDQRRIDFQSRGTFDRVLQGVSLLRQKGLEPGFLAVCHPESDARETCRFFVEEIGTKTFDVLIPDATHDDPPQDIAGYYCDLFDIWMDEYIAQGVSIRLLETMALSLLGVDSHVESIGYGPNTTSTLLTDGSLEPLDVLRTAGNHFTETGFNVLRNDLIDIQQDPLWREVLEKSLDLPAQCSQCRYRSACGGGHIGTRWSQKNRFDNPSVYCRQLMNIFDHMGKRLAREITVESARGKHYPLADAQRLIEQCLTEA